MVTGTLKKFITKCRHLTSLPGQVAGLSDQIANPSDQVKVFRDIVLFDQTRQLQSSHPNPLNAFGKKCFSQADEDGITLEILRRINKIEKGTYAEFGVGNGTENSTLILAALGWKGFWIGGEDLKFDAGHKDMNFCHLKVWIELGNIVELVNRGLTEIGAKELDVISLDLDGNDIYFVEELLVNEFRPKLFIVEYNSKFPPPVEFQITYDSKHVWGLDDYFGASLSSFNRLFNKFGYKLVCCNSHTGANAFFVDAAYSEYFIDVPTDINEIYVGPRYYVYNKHGHKQSVRTIQKILERNQ
jgi:hypothetical protein